MISSAIKTPVAFLYSSRVHSIAWVLSLWHLSDHLKEEFTLGTQMIKRNSWKCAQGVEKWSLGTRPGSIYTSRQLAVEPQETEWSWNFACSQRLFYPLSPPPNSSVSFSLKALPTIKVPLSKISPSFFLLYTISPIKISICSLWLISVNYLWKEPDSNNSEKEMNGWQCGAGGGILYILTVEKLSVHQCFSMRRLWHSRCNISLSWELSCVIQDFEHPWPLSIKCQ